MAGKSGLPRKRKLIQLYAALLYNAHAKGYIEGNIYIGSGKMLCVPGLNCYSCPGAIGACPLGALQNALASVGSKGPYYVIGILLLFGLTLGRTICGWLCPAGLGQELLHKIPTPKLPKGRLTGILSYTKYALLLLFVVVLPLLSAAQNMPLPAFCKYICPAGTLGGAVGLLLHPANADKFPMLGIFFLRKWLILMAVLLASIFIYRAFCRFLCPLGAIYGLFNRFALVGIRVKEDRCIRCGKCIASCPMDVKKLCDSECISCGKCIPLCPAKAISLQAGKRVLLGQMDPKARQRGQTSANPRVKRGAGAMMVLLLAGTLALVNLPAKKAPSASYADQEASFAENTLETGYETGQALGDFSLTTMAGDTFTLSNHRGKTVILNLWATWCGPCVKELPYFEALSRAYPEDLVILAIHSNLVTEDVKAYLSSYDYTFPFAVDETGDVIAALGGSTMLPQTIVVSPQGRVIYHQVGSVTYEKLEALVNQEEGK